MNRGLLVCLALLLTGLLSGPAEAGTLKRCMAGARSTREMQTCQQSALTQADGQLDAAYRAAAAALPADQKVKLRDAQRLWVQFRLTDCGAFYGAQSGSIATIQGGDCMITRARRRIKDLQEFVAR